MRLPLLVLALFAAVVPGLAGAQPASPRPRPAPLPALRIAIGPATFAGLARRSVTAREEDGATAVYDGVDLDAVLVAAGAPSGSAIGGPALAGVVLVRAADGYRAAFVLPELDPAFTERVTLLADRRNGAPIPPALGPYRVVIPDERRHARWVRQVTEIEVLPLP